MINFIFGFKLVIVVVIEYVDILRKMYKEEYMKEEIGLICLYILSVIFLLW